MRAYIWTLPTRIFHWLLAIYVLLLFLTSEEERLLDIHAAVGYGAGVLVLFRLIWGFVGPKYSRFSDWPLSLSEAKEFMFSLLAPKKSYPAHNPAAAFVMLGILLTTLIVVLSGILTYGIQEGRGVLAFLHSEFFKKMEVFEEVHELFAEFLLVLIGIHIAGVAVDFVLHKNEKTYSSMITGYKNIDAADARLNVSQKTVAAIFLSLAIIIPLTAPSSQTLSGSVFEEEEYEEHSLFKKECGSCHTLYPPFLLPSKSWREIMADLENHFGDDASLDEETRASIESFLISNSAENSTKEAAVYILSSLKEPVIAITQTPYWKEKHSKFDESIFKSDKITSRANCKACHKRVEKGLIEDNEISVPEA